MVKIAIKRRKTAPARPINLYVSASTIGFHRRYCKFETTPCMITVTYSFMLQHHWVSIGLL